ncbi:MAG: XrtA/PEP-CTERM system TPR-repeat protein PrsT [Methylococcales bacterium]
MDFANCHIAQNVSMIKRIYFLILFQIAFLPSISLAMAGEDALFKEAQDYFGRGETKAAIIQLKNLLKESPLNGDARLLLGQAHIKLGNGPSAVKELEKARDLHISKDQWLVPLARAYLMSRKPHKVLSEIQPDNDLSEKTRSEIYVLRGTANFAKQNVEQAEVDFNAALKIDKEKPDALLGLVRLALKNNDKPLAITLAKTVISKDANMGEAWVLLGEAQRLSDNAQEAVDSFGRAITILNNNIPARLGRATALISLKQFDKAQQDVDQIRTDFGDIPLAMYLLGLIAFQNGDMDGAEASLREVLNVAPTHMPSQLLMGTINYGKGNLAVAEKYLVKFHKATPKHLPAIKLLAAIHMKQNHPGKALAVLEPVHKEVKDDPQYLALLGSAYMQNKQHDQGTEYLDRAAKLAPDVAAIQTQLALGHIAAGEMDQAVGALEQAVDLGQNLVQADIMLVVALIQKKEFEKAINSARQLQKKMPDNPMPDNLIAAAYLAKGDNSKAEEHWQNALAINPDYSTASLNLAKLDIQRGKIDDAARHYQHILDSDSKHLGALVGMARIAETKGNTDELKKWLEKAKENNPDSIQPHLMLANFNLSINRPLKALDLANVAKKLDPDNPSVLRILGMAQQAAGKNANAVSTFTKLVARTKNSAEAHNLLAKVRYANGDVDRAMAEWDRALQINPDYLPAVIARTEYDIKEKRFQQATTRIRSLIEVYPKIAVGYQLEGQVEFAQQHYGEAVVAYDKAFEISPSSSLVVALHQAYLRNGDRISGQALLEKWLAEHESDIRNRLLLAMDYQNAGNKIKAMSTYEKAFLLAPENVVVVNNLAWLYQEMGNPKALSFAEKLLSLAGDSPETVDTAGWILAQNGEEQRALVLLQQAAMQAPHIPSIHYHLAETYVKVGRQGDARKELTRLLKGGKSFPEKTQAEKLLKSL